MPKRGTNPHPSRSNRFILVPTDPAVPGNRLLATDHWPLSTAVPQSAPAVPCKSLRNVLYCKVGPECAASHNCPPTLPRPPTMPTHSERQVLTLSPSHIAPGLAATSPKCTTRPPMPAPPPPAWVSCHEKDATVTVLRPFCTKTTLFAHFLSKNDKELTATASGYESPCQYPVTRREKVFFKIGPIRPKQRIRYPIDTLPIPGFRETSSPFASHPDAPGPMSDRIGPTFAHLRGATDKETDATSDFDPDFDPDFGARRRSGPRPGTSFKKSPG